MPTAMRYADRLDRAANGSRRRLQDSFAIGNRQVLEELSDVYRECCVRGWDGYDALPVEQDAMRSAYCILDTLPQGFPKPSLGAEPDGQLTLEWRRAPHRVLSVSVDPNGELHYAGVFGPNKKFGTIAFYSSAPDELLQLVREL